MHRVSRVDAGVAAGFALAGVAEAVLAGHAGAGHRLLNAVGAALLAALGVRRWRPALAIGAVGFAGVLVAVVPHLAWPPAGAEMTVPMLALMVASYSSARTVAPARCWCSASCSRWRSCSPPTSPLGCAAGRCSTASCSSRCSWGSSRCSSGGPCGLGSSA
ncbi:hypothetical protein [Dactylosporangium darangshiense]|uniref:hypothetical protein n=1 Tax=Dactylosporangium darangshiense TaxID=579108 RepID=UPI0036372A4F